MRVPRYVPVLLVVLAMATSGCASSPNTDASQTPTTEAAGAAVQDLSAILAKGPDFTDITSNSVTVLIDTKIPVVCAAAYGTDQAYGHLATDSDMAGGAHNNHHPVLSGLQPDTEYHIRMQGVGPDGTLYRSADYTVHTAKAQPGSEKPQGPNLALASAGAQVTGVSSNYGGDNNGQYGAAKAFDGDPSTQWSSNGDGNKAWIEIELANKTHVTNIGFWTRTMGSTAQISSFNVLADNGKTYGPFKLDDASGIHYFPTDFTAKKLRFQAVDTSGGNTGAVEIEVYGQPQP